MSWLKTFTLSLEVINAAVETLYYFGHSDDIKETQVGLLVLLGGGVRVNSLNSP